MKTTEQQITDLHRRARELQQRRERNILTALAVLSLALTGALSRLTAAFTGPSPEAAEDSFTASSLLNESAGGYIMTAVLAFMVGVVITVICVRLQRQNKASQIPSGTEKPIEPDPHPEINKENQK